MLSFTILEKSIKFINKTDKTIEVKIAPRLKGSLYPLVSAIKTFKSGEWWVPNFDWTGCSVISVFDNLTNIELQRIILPRHFYELNKPKQNVICIGLNKTGTTSFAGGMQSLGYNLFTESVGHNTLFPDIYHSSWGSTITALENERYNLYQDMPFSLPGVYKKIYEFRPDDIYILTIRDSVEQFINTCKNFYRKQFQYNDIQNLDEKLFYRFESSNVVTIHLENLFYSKFDFWGIKTFDNIEKKLEDVYNKHNDDVVNFFESKNCSNFRIVNVSKPGELKSVADWLRKETDNSDFPWLNKGVEFTN
jgi:hypothetical protein